MAAKGKTAQRAEYFGARLFCQSQSRRVGQALILRFTPLGGAFLILLASLDPIGAAVGKAFPFPEGRAGFQPIYEESTAFERRLPVPRGCCHQYDALAWRKRSHAMYDPYTQQ